MPPWMRQRPALGDVAHDTTPIFAACLPSRVFPEAPARLLCLRSGGMVRELSRLGVHSRPQGTTHAPRRNGAACHPAARTASITRRARSGVTGPTVGPSAVKRSPESGSTGELIALQGATFNLLELAALILGFSHDELLRRSVAAELPEGGAIVLGPSLRDRRDVLPFAWPSTSWPGSPPRRVPSPCRPGLGRRVRVRPAGPGSTSARRRRDCSASSCSARRARSDRSGRDSPRSTMRATATRSTGPRCHARAPASPRSAVSPAAGLEVDKYTFHTAIAEAVVRHHREHGWSSQQESLLAAVAPVEATCRKCPSSREQPAAMPPGPRGAAYRRPPCPYRTACCGTSSLSTLHISDMTELFGFGFGPSWDRCVACQSSI